MTLALIIVATHIGHLPQVLGQIIGGAFGFTQMAGGFTGGVAAAMLNGVAWPVPTRQVCGQRPQRRRHRDRLASGQAGLIQSPACSSTP